MFWNFEDPLLGGQWRYGSYHYPMMLLETV